MAGDFLLSPQVTATPPQPQPGSGSTAIERLQANSASRRAAAEAAKTGSALQIIKPNFIIALSQDARDRAGSCMVKTGGFLSTAVGSLAVVALTAAGVSLAGAGVAVTEIVAGGVALNWLFGWASRPLIAAGAVALGEKPGETIKRVLG